jgi:hypothetical protein
LILSSVMLSGCLETFAPTRPVGVPLSLPPNLRQCDEAVATTEPTTFATVGDLLVGYGVERTGRLEVSACHRETVRLIDVHNEQMSTGKLGGS